MCGGCKKVRSFEYADFLRVVGTYSEIQKMSLLADISIVSKRMTLWVRDFSKLNSNCLEIFTVFLLAGVPAIMTGGVDESGNILLAIPCTSMDPRHFCLQGCWRYREVRFFEYADILRVISTYSEVLKAFLLADILNVLMRMTFGIRDCPQGYFSCSQTYLLPLLAEAMEMYRRLIHESGDYPRSVPTYFDVSAIFLLAGVAKILKSRVLRVRE